MAHLVAHLIVKLHGEQILKLALEPGHEYMAGRSADAQIRLEGQKGISRQHFKIFEQDGKWICQSLSKHMPFFVGKTSTEILELEGSQNFSLPPYEFIFESEPTKKEMAEARSQPGIEESAKGKGQLNLPAFRNPEGVSDTASTGVNSEATLAGQASLVPYLRLSYPNTADDEILKLEGHLWVAGRDSDCEIHIDSPHISRKHFEISKTKEGYFLTDLGSSNGTKINSQRIASHEPTRLESGDEIGVKNIRLFFEIRDTQFGNRLDNLPAVSFDPSFGGQFPVPYRPAELPQAVYDPTLYHGRSVEEAPPESAFAKFKKNKVRMAIVALIPLLLIAILKPDSKKEEKPRLPANSPTTSLTFEGLTKEQQTVVKDSFTLARNLYVQGKYALCLTELAKLHEIIPQFENSKEQQAFCEQGMELVDRARDQERQRKEKEKIEQQITGYVETCKEKINELSTVDEVSRCLAPALELNPDHDAVKEMIHTAQIKADERKFMDQQKAEAEKEVQRGEAHFLKAVALQEKKQFLEAIKEFERYLKSSYPRSAANKEDARKRVATIKEGLKKVVDFYMDQCKTLVDKNRYKDAWLACDQALKADPGTEEASQIKTQMLSKLRSEMKSIYEDSVLEESLGNVDTAKEKWRKIIQENLPFDDYTLKSKSKLQKYGVGI